MIGRVIREVSVVLKTDNSIYCESVGITMELKFDTYERELIIEALEYRIENDEELIRDYSTKEELTYLLEKIAEDL